MKEKIRLLLLDLDETLISKQNRPLEDFSKLFEFLSSNDIKFSFATGRGMYFIEHLLKNDPVFLDTYFIIHDGALIMNPLRKDMLHSSIISPDILDVFLRKEYATKLFFNQLEAIRSLEDNLEEDSSLRPFWQKYIHESKTYQLYGRNISSDEARDFADTCEEHGLLSYCFPYRKNPSHFSTLAINKGNSKGNAVKILADYLSIPLHEIMIVGDGINDLSSFELDAITVATTHAVPEIKTLAKFILTENQNIYSFIKNYLES